MPAKRFVAPPPNTPRGKQPKRKAISLFSLLAFCTEFRNFTERISKLARDPQNARGAATFASVTNGQQAEWATRRRGTAIPKRGISAFDCAAWQEFLETYSSTPKSSRNRVFVAKSPRNVFPSWFFLSKIIRLEAFLPHVRKKAYVSEETCHEGGLQRIFRKTRIRLGCFLPCSEDTKQERRPREAAIEIRALHD